MAITKEKLKEYGIPEDKIDFVSQELDAEFKQVRESVQKRNGLIDIKELEKVQIDSFLNSVPEENKEKVKNSLDKLTGTFDEKVATLKELNPNLFNSKYDSPKAVDPLTLIAETINKTSAQNTTKKKVDEIKDRGIRSKEELEEYTRAVFEN